MTKLFSSNRVLLAVGWLLAWIATRVTMAYDLVGNRTLMADSTGSTTSTFDPLNRTESVVNPAGARITYSYTPVGLRAAMQDPNGGRYTYAYDAARRLNHLVNPLAERTTYGWDSAGQLRTQILANTTSASLTYDAAGQIKFLANWRDIRVRLYLLTGLDRGLRA